MNEEYRNDAAVFCWKCGKMLSLGIPILQALELAAEQTDNPEIVRAAHTMVVEVKAQRRLSEAMEQFPDLFDTVSVELVKTGEMTGTLDEVMMMLAQRTLAEPIYQWMAERRK